MYTLANLPDTIPLFPLTGVLLFSRCRLPLYIFEPRYIAMIQDCLKSEHRLIGMIQSRTDDEADLYRVGCAGRLASAMTVPGDRYAIVLQGVARFRLDTRIEGFVPYAKGRVRWAEFEEDLGETESDDGLDRDRFMVSVERHFKIAGIDGDPMPLTELSDDMLVNTVAMFCNFTPADKQALLEIGTLRERRNAIETLLAFDVSGEEHSLQ